MQGLVVSLDRGYPLVRTENGEERAQHAIDLVKNSDVRSAVGDIVDLNKEPGQDMLSIVALHKRDNILSRRELVESVHEGVGKIKEQILAANFDFVVVMQSLGKRALDVDYLERQLVMANDSSVETMVLLTKTDLLPYVNFDMEMFRRDVRSLNPKSPIVELNLMSGTGIDEWLSFISTKLQEKRHHAG